MRRKQANLAPFGETCCMKKNITISGLTAENLKLSTEFSPQNLGGGQWRRCGGTCGCAQGSSSCQFSKGRHEASNSCTANCIHVEGYSTIRGSQGHLRGQISHPSAKNGSVHLASQLWLTIAGCRTSANDGIDVVAHANSRNKGLDKNQHFGSTQTIS